VPKADPDASVDLGIVTGFLAPHNVCCCDLLVSKFLEAMIDKLQPIREAASKPTIGQTHHCLRCMQIMQTKQ
jgi:hypothetical protein